MVEHLVADLQEGTRSKLSYELTIHVASSVEM